MQDFGPFDRPVVGAGTGGLRVVDAPTPRIISGSARSPAVMIAVRKAAMILEDAKAA